MRLTQDVALVGSGDTGFSISNPIDCHVYLIDGGNEVALIDAGIGGEEGAAGQILSNAANDGYDLSRISRLLLTHYHADHAGGASDLRDKLGLTVHGSRLTAHVMEAGDEEAISLNVAKLSGLYPHDYVFRPCPTIADLNES